MIEDAGGVDKALVAYKDMIGKALDPNSKISASERVNGIALAGMIVLSGGGKIAGKGPHADPNITTRLIETEALPGSVPDLRGQVGASVWTRNPRYVRAGRSRTLVLNLRMERWG